MRDAFFLVFGLFTIASALGVVVSRHPIYSAFSLVLSFFGLSGLYLLWGSGFMAMLQILIYTGAIVVLFVFVVMLLNPDKEAATENTSSPVILLFGGVVWAFSLLVLRVLNRATYFVNGDPPTAFDMRHIAELLFSRYLWPFEVLSLFLLALLIAVCALARPERKKGRAR